MIKPSFDQLCRILHNDLKVDHHQLRRSTRENPPITEKMTVAMGLRYMGGKFSKSCSDIFGTSLSTPDRIINRSLKAVDKSPHTNLSIDLLPRDEMEMNRNVLKCNSRSGAGHLYFGFIGAIDGLLCTCEKPPDVPNSSDYFSAHYQRFGYNEQAICDCNLRIIWVDLVKLMIHVYSESLLG